MGSRRTLARGAGLWLVASGLAVSAFAGVAVADTPVPAIASAAAVEETASPAPSEEPFESPSAEQSETPSEETPSEEPSGEPSEEPPEEATEEPASAGPTIEPDDPEPTISPTVLGVKIRRPAAPATLPETGADETRTVVALALLLTVVGAGLVHGAGRYERRH